MTIRDGDAIIKAFGGRRYRKGWLFHCPVPTHRDRHASCFMWKSGGLKCFAGCSSESVVAALDAAGFKATAVSGPTSLAGARQQEEAQTCVLSCNAKQLESNNPEKEKDQRLAMEHYARAKELGSQLPPPTFHGK